MGVWENNKNTANNLQCHPYCTAAWFRLKDNLGVTFIVIKDSCRTMKGKSMRNFCHFKKLFVPFPNRGTHLLYRIIICASLIDKRLVETNSKEKWYLGTFQATHLFEYILHRTSLLRVWSGIFLVCKKAFKSLACICKDILSPLQCKEPFLYFQSYKVCMMS